jgi:hypothetical protein
MSLDPKATRLEKELEELKLDVPPPLNPPFPYRPVTFDPDAFGTEEPPPVDVATG